MTVDHMIRKAIDDGLLVVDTINGKVFSKKSGQIREIKPESNRKGYHRFSFYKEYEMEEMDAREV